MSASLLDLVKAYGDACGNRDGDGSAPVELAVVAERVEWAARMIRKAGQGAGQFEASLYLAEAIEALEGHS